MVNRSLPVLGRARLLSLLVLVVFVSYVVIVNGRWLDLKVIPLVTFFSVVGILTLSLMSAGVWWRSFKQFPPAQGRIIAIVPVYNERDELVHAAVRSIINQSRPPDEIHVIDDGSAVPLTTFDHPLVTWHRQENAGKRHAQAHALKKFTADDWDFILTVDSDSVLDPDATEHMLRAMSNPRIMACTGMIYVRNWNENLLTRLIDINIVTSCLMFRMFRSWFGMVTPTSGALALYRANIVYDHMEHYLISGTAGDDRQLSFYALRRGQVVGVAEAVVETELPSTFKGTFRQRLRWSKSAWLGIPYVLKYLSMPNVLLYMYPLAFALMWPFIVVTLLQIFNLSGRPVFIYGAIFWFVVSMCMTTIYSMYRPTMTARQKWTQWVLGPLYPVMGVVLLRPASYWALTKLNSTSWHTREVEPVFEPVVSEMVVSEPVVAAQTAWSAMQDEHRLFKSVGSRRAEGKVHRYLYSPENKTWYVGCRRPHHSPIMGREVPPDTEITCRRCGSSQRVSYPSGRGKHVRV